MSEVTLITFPPSLDSELSRFLLQHYAIEHREERHTLYFCFAATLARGFTMLFPLLSSDSYRLSHVREIVDHFDPLARPENRLLPPDPNRAKSEEDWPLFNDTLAYATAVFAYYHLLPHKPIMVRPLSEGAPAYEVRAVERAYPLFSGLLRLLLRLTASRARDALATAERVLSAVEKRIADGRPYLLGDRFSLSDMAFAVAAAPLVLPDGYGGSLPTLDEMPDAMQAAIRATRQRPAGQFALRIYRDHRASGQAAIRKAVGT